MKTITLEEAVRHWAERRTVQASANGKAWSNVAPFGRCPSESEMGIYVFTNPDYLFRLHPTRKIVPFTFDTVPKFALLRAESGSAIISTAWDQHGMMLFTGKSGWHIEPYEIVLRDWQISLDNGKTWGPAGLEVEE